MVAVMSDVHHIPAEYSLVVGLGASGLAAARFLHRLGEPVCVIDSREQPPELAALTRDCPDIPVVTATLEPTWLERASRVVLSPGLSTGIPLVTEARERGMEIIGELELFARSVNAPVLAITGSNGKSTVATLVSHLLQAQGMLAPAGGNLGPAALELLRDDADVYVLEVSSFQMETTQSLAPLAAAVLNISPDHIDRHGSLERYAELKMSLLQMADSAVINWDDPLVRELAPRATSTIPFSVAEGLPVGWSVVEQAGRRWLARNGEALMPSDELLLPGEIGEANALAALALASCMGGALDSALGALRNFRGLAHRRQFVGSHAGVTYVDDSKGTNVGATVAALTSATTPVVLIAGGQAKGADFAPLLKAARGRVRAAVLLGEAASELEALFAGTLPTERVAGMQQAVTQAARLAQAGDCVLLSPACASQDVFRDYRHRGDVFAAAVAELGR